MLTIRILCERWVDARLHAGIRRLTASGYRTSLRSLVDHLGDRRADSITIDDMLRHRRYLLDRLSQGTAKVRWDISMAMVRWAQDRSEIPYFLVPRDLRRMRGSPPFRRVFSPQEIVRLLACACAKMRLLILLGINLGYGNRDCARLQDRHVSGHIVDAPRFKTGADRRNWLWPETLEALSEVGLPIENARGLPIVSDGQDYIKPRMHALMRRAGVPSNRRGFYSFRRSYRTAIDDHWDRPAIDLTMGHSTPGMGARYVAWISDDRIRQVSVHARSKLLCEGQNGMSSPMEPPLRLAGGS